MKPTVERLDSLVNVHVQELPGQGESMDPAKAQETFGDVSSVVYVIDSQDEYLMALQDIVQVIEQAYRVNPKIHFEALIHKVDGLNEDFRQDTQRDIIQRVTDELSDVGITDADVTFYMTSIFDNSIIEAFSRIIQKLVPEFPTLTQMLDLLCTRSGLEKAFLFDSGSKIYLATDSNPVDVESYQVCSDFIDVSIDLNQLYQEKERKSEVSACSRLQNGVVIHLHEMIKGLLLVSLSRGDNQEKGPLLDHNVEIFKRGLKDIYPE